MPALLLNGKSVNVDAAPDTPLLWVLRDHLNMTGTKFGSRRLACACTVHVDGMPTRSCVTPLSAVAGKKVTSIEGVAGDKVATAVQSRVGQDQVPECGYCQSDRVMAATALLTNTPKPSDAQIRKP